MKQKYSTVEELIGQKAGGVADAKKRAESLQNEAKQLLLQASDKLQLLKGDIIINQMSDLVMYKYKEKTSLAILFQKKSNALP